MWCGWKSLWALNGNRALAVWSAVLGMAAMCAGGLSAQTVATYNFENGTDGWVSFNGASAPVQSNGAAYSGSYSLLTTTGSGGAGGPSIAVTGVLQAGATYTITGYVRLTSGEATSNADFTVKRSDPSCSGGACYDTIGSYQVPVSDTGWAQIGGSYTPSTTETALTLYAQLVGATSAQSFYLDDVVITETAPPPGGSTVATYTFSGGTDGWTPFGSVTLASAAPPVTDPTGDADSLQVTNRTAGYTGPSLNLLGVNKVVAGATYQVTAYVLLATGDPSGPTVTMSTKTADCATSGAYSNIATSSALSTTVWTKVQGTFSFSNLPGPPTTLVLYIQSSSATDSFYVGDVTISQLSPPPPSPGQQDNTGITSTFEDGGTDGWGSRSGTSSVANTTAAAHSGTHSLLTTGRIANWDGPQISVNNKMYPGSVYNVSGWVMLTPADGSNHVINISVQTTLSGNASYSSVTGYPGVTVAADGQWHQINVMGYNMSSNYDPGQAYLYFQTVPPSGNDLVSFYLDDFQLTYVQPPTIQTNIPSIYKTLAQFFPVGAAVDMTDLSGPHAQLLGMHFDSITPGNDMKWASVESSAGVFDFANADAEVGEAVCNGSRIRGHNLVWASGSQTPSYAYGDGTNSAANQATVKQNIVEHIQNEVQHFGSKVYAWDVVNEPLDPSQPDCLLHGPFYQVLGKSYIDLAFQTAQQYAPAGTKLFLNDYSTTDPARQACLLKVVGDLRSRGIPIDGIGHEMHNAINYPSTAAMVNAINTVAEDFPGIDQQVTELDMSVYNAGDTKSNYGNNIPPSVLAEQGWLYKQYFDAFRQLSGKLSAVTIWGMADDDTWLDSFPVTRTDYPLPFDMQLQAKPAYWGIVDPTQLPGYGMTFAITSSTGSRDARILTVTATNGNAGPAYATQLNGMTVTPLPRNCEGDGDAACRNDDRRDDDGRRCTATVTAPATLPVVLGDIATGGNAQATFQVDVDHCSDETHFLVSVPWSSAVYDTGTATQVVDFDRDQRDDHEEGQDRH